MLRFEAVQESDFEAMADLRADALRASLEHLGRFDALRVRERLRSAFVPDCMRHLVWHGQRIGYLTLIPQTDAAVLRLHHLYIRPGHQCQGVGKLALDWVKAQATAQGRAVTLSALRDSAANRFYLRHGFQRVGAHGFDIEYRWSPVLVATPEGVAP